VFDKFLEKGFIRLPNSKRPEKIKRTNDPKYRKYHRIISQSIEKCNAFREQVLQLTKEGKTILDKEDVEDLINHLSQLY